MLRYLRHRLSKLVGPNKQDFGVGVFPLTEQPLTELLSPLKVTVVLMLRLMTNAKMAAHTHAPLTKTK